MNQSNHSDFNHFEKEDDFDWKNMVFQYLYFWKYFAGTILLFLFISFFYLKYTNEVYLSTAKIKILDKQENNLELPSAADLFSNSKINLENEVEIINSYPILEQVVRNLNLTTQIIAIGNIQESLEMTYPFKIISILPIDSISKSSYRLNLRNEGLEIIDYQNDDKAYLFKNFKTYGTTHALPFEIDNLDKNKWNDFDNEGYYILLNSIKSIVSNLKNEIEIKVVGKKSDVISLNLNSINSIYSELVLNELINVFDNDGIKDRQLIHKRTIDFVNDRYAYLSLELDSIEIKKQLFKINNDLVDISANSTISLQQSRKSEESVFSIENQISITNLLIESLDNTDLGLLPAKIGIENKEINLLISEYNQAILNRKKLILSAGSNNPSIKQVENLINDTKSNIIFSLESHLVQLKNLKNKFSRQFNKFDNQISTLPEKEKILRAIERNQTIKEALYLFLLQKREEAEVSYAVTEPSIKVIEYAISRSQPVSPQAEMIYLLAILLGLLLPFGVIYLIFIFDNKVHSKDDITLIGGSFVGEIPFVIEEEDKLFSSPNSRSIIAESFRMIASNFKYILPKEKDCHVIISTSTIKSEGKTFTAINLSLSLASFNKKVLLIGCDLRNPQLHKYIKKEKDLLGLSTYLVDNTSDWRKNLLNHFEEFPSHYTLLSGPLPPNPLQLLNNGNLDILLEEAKKEYDYIVLDTAPTLLVSDTITISSHSDAILYVVRANLTEKELLNFPKELISDEKLKNVGFVLNGIGSTNKYGYQYGYKYGYGYGYKYSYNYGYGYGYQEDN